MALTPKEIRAALDARRERDATNVAHALFHRGPMTWGQIAHTVIKPPPANTPLSRHTCELDRAAIALDTLRERGIITRVGWRAGATLYAHI